MEGGTAAIMVARRLGGIVMASVIASKEHNGNTWSSDSIDRPTEDERVLATGRPPVLRKRRRTRRSVGGKSGPAPVPVEDEIERR